MFDAENLENFLELIFINDKHCRENMKTKPSIKIHLIAISGRLREASFNGSYFRESSKHQRNR